MHGFNGRLYISLLTQIVQEWNVDDWQLVPWKCSISVTVFRMNIIEIKKQIIGDMQCLFQQHTVDWFCNN